VADGQLSRESCDQWDDAVSTVQATDPRRTGESEPFQLKRAFAAVFGRVASTASIWRSASGRTEGGRDARDCGDECFRERVEL
jgi:hypothetical protein